jgi:hypothetical protein
MRPAVPSTEQRRSSSSSGSASRAEADSAGDEKKKAAFSIENEWHRLQFGADGVLASVVDVPSNVTTPVSVSFLSYTPYPAGLNPPSAKPAEGQQQEQSSGAYIFR